MECLRCGATLKDKTLVCNKCGFIVKGSRKLDNFQPQMTFEQTVEMATEDELRAMLYAIKRQRDASYVVEEELSPEEKVIASGRRWANASLICGTHELLSNCLDEKCRNDRAVDTARQSEQYLFVSYLRAYLRYLLVDKLSGKLGSGDALHCLGSDNRIHLYPPIVLKNLIIIL